MTQSLLDTFIIACLALLLWGLLRSERIYQYPFLIGAMLSSFLLPQAIALVNDPGAAPIIAVNKALIMASLCAVMSWFGYLFKPNVRFLNSLNYGLDSKRLFQAGIVLSLASLVSTIILGRIDIQTSEIGTWTGPATILYFFGNLRYIGFAIFLSITLRCPTPANILLTFLSSYPIIEIIAFRGRRTPVMIFLITIGLTLFYIKRYLPPRVLVATITVLGAFLIPLVGKLRGDFWFAIFSGDFASIDFNSGLERVIEGDILEFRNAAILIDASDRLGQFGFGTGFWDDIVFRFVPAQLLGAGFKRALQLHWSVDLQTVSELYQYQFPAGVTFTGIGDTYMQFSYFGCLVFALIGYLFKNLWVSSLYLNSIVSQIFYMGLVSPMLVGVTHGIGRFIQDAIFQVIFLGLALRYARLRRNEQYSLDTLLSSSSSQTELP
jgi:hypothetical protein